MSMDANTKPREASSAPAERVTVRQIAQDDHEIMSLLTARLYLETIAVDYRGYMTPENLAARNVWSEAQECFEWLSEAGGRMTVAFAGGRLAGYAAYCPNASEPLDHDWSLEGFFVLPAEQGRGTGTRLLSAAVDDMVAAGGRKLVVATFTGSRAEGYYQRAGARLLYVTGNPHFGKPNDVSFLGWELPELQQLLAAKLKQRQAGESRTTAAPRPPEPGEMDSAAAAVAANREAWGLLSKDHYEHFKWRLQTEHSLLNRIITAELGDISGKTVIHLQCNTGADTLSLARLGAAHVTGVDLVPRNVEYAQRLASDLGFTNAEFLVSDIMELESRHHRKYDVVFTSEGALCWLPDLNKWARAIRHLLKDDGFLYVFDSHPFLMALDEAKVGHGVVDVKYPYFAKRPDKSDTIGGYAAEARPGENYCWMYTVSDLINSLTSAGLQVEWFNESDLLFFREDGMRQAEPGLWACPELRGKLPMTFSIKATVRRG